MKKLVSLVLALMLCLSCVSALAAEAWTVTCPWAPSGVAAMVNQKAAALSTTYSNDYVIVANAEKGDTATITLSMEVKNAAEIKLVMNKLNSIKDVLEVSRASGKAK